jgi:hypothetical protein
MCVRYELEYIDNIKRRSFMALDSPACTAIALGGG